MSAVEGRHLQAGGVRLWVEPGGAGEPVLLIAGLGYATWCWRELRREMGDRPPFPDKSGTDHDSIGNGGLSPISLNAFDNRGAGRSDQPAGPYTIAQLADDAAAVLDALGLARVAVLGHSMGGYIALTLALRHPRRVRALALVGTSAGGPGLAPVPEETLNTWKLAGSLPPAEYARRSMPRSFAPGWCEAHPAEFESILARRLEFPTPGPSWLAQYMACADYVARGIEAEKVDVPALVIHGREDRVVPHANGELLARRLPRAEFVSLPAAGHLPFLEDPPAFAALVRGHLREPAQ